MTERSLDGPTITIVTACYNSVPFLARIHASLQRQTYRKFEWICVDDCSTDDTVAELLKLEPPGELGMQVYRLPQNSGGGLPVALGTLRANGDATIWLDHDDEMFDWALEEVATHWPTVERDPSLSGLAFAAIFGDGSTIGRPRYKVGQRMTWNKAVNTMPNVSDGTFCFRTDLLKRFATLDFMEGLALSGSLYGRMTKAFPYVIPGTRPVRYYHLDNPESQTNFPRISVKTVISYARIVDNFDLYSLIRPVNWLKHIGMMLHYSKLVTGRWLYCTEQIHRRSMRILVLICWPLGYLAQMRQGGARVVSYTPADLDELRRLPPLHH